MINIQEEYILSESLDDPHELDGPHESGDMDNIRKMGYDFHNYYTVKSNPDESYHVLGKNDVMEIHHGMGDHMPGTLISSCHNSKFVATMFNIAKGLLDSGKAVKIVGPNHNGLFNHYNRIANILAKKHGYTVTTPIDEPDHSGVGHPLKAITIYTPQKSMAKYLGDAVMESRTLENNYVGKTHKQILEGK